MSGRILRGEGLLLRHESIHAISPCVPPGIRELRLELLAVAS